jgi:hypothetical protein
MKQEKKASPEASKEASPAPLTEDKHPKEPIKPQNRPPSRADSKLVAMPDMKVLFGGRRAKSVDIASHAGTSSNSETKPGNLQRTLSSEGSVTITSRKDETSPVVKTKKHRKTPTMPEAPRVAPPETND